ncbi:MAG: amidohydrolase [Chitinophagaceae bacterium]|nr:amidohydrolase [Rubrivivax sp.]
MSVDASRRRLLAGAGMLALGAKVHAQAALPIFDAHLHYSHDAWERLPPSAAVALLRQAGLKRAMVSSSSDEGTQLLYAAAPDLVLPSLRPYRTRGEIGSWMNDGSVVAHLESRLARYRYVAIGEYHIYGADADLPVVRRVVQLARENGLFLHSHSDAEAIDRQFKQDPNARILWAHAGFDNAERVRETLRKHPRLYCDLAFRSDHATMGRVDATWRAAFLEFPDRFMVGTDTFTPERWYYVVEHAEWSRRWLADLPRESGERIAWKNGETLFGGLLAAPTVPR